MDRNSSQVFSRLTSSYLPLLPSGPDGVCNRNHRKTRPSSFLFHQVALAFFSSQHAFSVPRWRVSGNRGPPAPHLAQPGIFGQRANSRLRLEIAEKHFACAKLKAISQHYGFNSTGSTKIDFTSISVLRTPLVLSRSAKVLIISLFISTSFCISGSRQSESSSV